MPFTSQIDLVRRRIVTVATGPLTFRDLSAHLERAAVAKVTGYPELIDARAATIPLETTFEHVRQAAELLQTLAAGQTAGAAAVVVGDDVTFGVICQFAVLAEAAALVHPFRTEPAARAWLGWEAGPCGVGSD